jgi:hypothetical protein
MPGRLHLPILGSRNPVKWGFGGFKWGFAPLETPKFPPPVGDNRLDAIALPTMHLSFLRLYRIKGVLNGEEI